MTYTLSSWEWPPPIPPLSCLIQCPNDYVPDLFDLIITVSSDFWDSQGIEGKTMGLCWCSASYVNVQSCQLNGLNSFLNVMGLRNQNQDLLSWEESLISYVCNFCKCQFVNCVYFCLDNLYNSTTRNWFKNNKSKLFFIIIIIVIIILSPWKMLSTVCMKIGLQTLNNTRRLMQLFQ